MTTIYDEIGGAAAVGAAVDGFYERVIGDQTIAHHFAGIDLARLKGHQRSFLAAAIGGPDAYLGRAMRAAHADVDVSGHDFDRVVGHLVAELSDIGVPAATIEAIGSVLGALKDEVVTADSR